MARFSDAALTPPNSQPEQSFRVAICIFGVVARSIRHTWPSVETHLLAPLRNLSGVEPRIFVFNQQPPAGTTVDGFLLNQSDVDIVPASFRTDVSRHRES